jgi:predicted RNA-binding Zn-ribbon protein involved in translation (DUF1610 family)
MSKKNKLKRIKPKNTEISEFDFLICPNCGEEEVGKFCPSCGQSNKDYNKPMKEIFADLLDSINLDIRLFNTLIPFFTKPGFLAQEYFNGRRKRYVPPLRLYMFFSIIFFFLVQWSSEKTMDEKIDDNANVDVENIVNGVSKELSNNINGISFFADSLMVDSIQTDTIEKKSKNNNIINISDEEREKIKDEILNDSTISEPIKKIAQGGLNAAENQKLFTDNFFENLSLVLFLLMPLFALILAMILWRSKMLYVNHLIFSINFHSFIFGLGSVFIILREILPDHLSENVFYLAWGVPIYLMLGIMQFYKRGYVGAFFKMFGAILIYNFIICLALLGIVVLTAYNLSYL